MRSPELRLLLGKEVLFASNSNAYLVMLCLSTVLLGYSFHEAIGIFSEASRAALQAKELAPGMNPYDGVFVPTFGGLYLVTTLFFPFVALRGLGSERQSGSLKLMLQLPGSAFLVFCVKLAAVCVLWAAALVPAVTVVAIWKTAGGHVHAPELLNLLLGHALYAFTVAGFAFLAAALTTSSATAAIVVIALTLGSWVLDFAAGSPTGGVLSGLSGLSLTLNLRSFERGVFSTVEGARLLLLGAASFLLSCVWLQTGRRVSERARSSLIVVLLALASYGLVSAWPVSFDVREDRRNSFRPENEAALRKMRSPVRITVHMTPDDSRYRDFERKVLTKLRRLLPRVEIELVRSGKAAFFGVGQVTDDYGKIVLEYEGRREATLSNSPEEILPILHRLAGAEVKTSAASPYPGYPLVLENARPDVWFYFILPLMYAALWLGLRRAPGLIRVEGNA